MKKQAEIYLLFLIANSLAYCSVPKALYVHLPDKVNSPGFKERGEAKADISVQPVEHVNGGVPFIYNCNLAYAPLNHLGIIASYQGAHNLSMGHDYGNFGVYGSTANEEFHLSSSMVDLGIGYFVKEESKGIFECYGGYGLGFIRNKANGYDDPGDYYGAFHRIFLQMDYCFPLKKAMLMAGFRTMYKKYDAFTTGSQAKIDTAAIVQVKTSNFMLLQPFIEVQAGNRFVRFSMQLGYQISLKGFNSSSATGNQFDLNSGYSFYPSMLYFALGVSFHSAPRFRKIGFREREGEKKSDLW